MYNEKLHEPEIFDLGLSAIVDEAYDLVYKKYDHNSECPKSFHNLVHTDCVVDATLGIADLALVDGLITPNDRKLLIIAAAYHDTEQQLGSGANEEASGELAIEAMRKIGGFSPEDEETVKNIIMATKVYFDKDGVMHQSASEDYRTKIIADADLSHLGGPTDLYVEKFVCLFHELNPGLGTDSEKFRAFLKNQKKFMLNHQYYTQEASELFSNKIINTEYSNYLAEPLNK